MITLAQYFGAWKDHPDATPLMVANAVTILLPAVARLEARMLAHGVVFPKNPVSGSGLSGDRYGGFRPKDCMVGAPGSSHKEALGLDRFDPHNAIDDWLLANEHALVECGLFIEHPSATPRWSHWTVRPPKSGNRIFIP